MDESGKAYAAVPGNWEKALGSKAAPGLGFGTYRLRLRTDPDSHSLYSLLVTGARTSSAVYIDGKRLGGSGTPTAVKSKDSASVTPYCVSFPADQESIDIVIHAANYDYLGKGGGRRKEDQPEVSGWPDYTKGLFGKAE